MRFVLTCLAITLLPGVPAAHAQQIAADRPGIGSAPTVVPQFTLQPELGTDGKEIRLGIVPGFELDHDDSSWAAKLALVSREKFKLAFKASYDNDLHTVLEIPANYTFNALFNLGTTVIWSRSSRTYAANFNFTPTGRLTITSTLYYESKPRAAIFVGWIVPRHDNWQLDVSYDQHRVNAGISTALNFARLFRQR